MKYVNKAVPKVDSKALITGKPVYTDDLAPKDCLVVKVLRSPYAHALIQEILRDGYSYESSGDCLCAYLPRLSEQTIIF